VVGCFEPLRLGRCSRLSVLVCCVRLDVCLLVSLAPTTPSPVQVNSVSQQTHPDTRSEQGFHFESGQDFCPCKDCIKIGPPCCQQGNSVGLPADVCSLVRSFVCSFLMMHGSVVSRVVVVIWSSFAVYLSTDGGIRICVCGSVWIPCFFASI